MQVSDPCARQPIPKLCPSLPVQQSLQSITTAAISSLTATAYLGFVGVHQRGRGSHHGAAARPWQRGDLRLRWLLRFLLQHVPQPLQVIHQWPLRALLGPVWLQQAAQHSHVEVRGVARLLARRNHQGHPAPKSRSSNVSHQIDPSGLLGYTA